MCGLYVIKKIHRNVTLLCTKVYLVLNVSFILFSRRWKRTLARLWQLVTQPRLFHYACKLTRAGTTRDTHTYRSWLDYIFQNILYKTSIRPGREIKFRMLFGKRVIVWGETFWEIYIGNWSLGRILFWSLPDSGRSGSSSDSVPESRPSSCNTEISQLVVVVVTYYSISRHFTTGILTSLQADSCFIFRFE